MMVTNEKRWFGIKETFVYVHKNGHSTVCSGRNNIKHEWRNHQIWWRASAFPQMDCDCCSCRSSKSSTDGVLLVCSLVIQRRFDLTKNMKNLFFPALCWNIVMKLRSFSSSLRFLDNGCSCEDVSSIKHVSPPEQMWFIQLLCKDCMSCEVSQPHFWLLISEELGELKWSCEVSDLVISFLAHQHC